MPFPLADIPSERETGGLPFSERYMSRNIRAVKTGVFRNPKRGEWYLSGAIPEAYKAPNDLSSPFHILKLVKVEVRTVVTEKVLPL